VGDGNVEREYVRPVWLKRFGSTALSLTLLSGANLFRLSFARPELQTCAAVLMLRSAASRQARSPELRTNRPSARTFSLTLREKGEGKKRPPLVGGLVFGGGTSAALMLASRVSPPLSTEAALVFARSAVGRASAQIASRPNISRHKVSSSPHILSIHLFICLRSYAEWESTVPRRAYHELKESRVSPLHNMLICFSDKQAHARVRNSCE
jgi:hypothetical protein